MSIGMCKVNKLFTIERVSVDGCVWKDEWIDGMSGWGREQDGVWRWGYVGVDRLGLQLVGLGRVKLGLGDRGDGNWGGVKL